MVFLQIPTLSARMARFIPPVLLRGRPPLLPDIRNHTWQFPVSRMARILSPKTPSKNRRLLLVPGTDQSYRDSFSNYACTVDNLESALEWAYASMPPASKKWTRVKDKSFHYEPLSCLLNQCIQAAHAGLDADSDFAIKKPDRWYADLRFVGVRPPIKDQDEVDHPTPGLAGVCVGDVKEGDTLRWNPPTLDDDNLNSGRPLQIQIPVEVGKGWLRIVHQSSLHARRLFYAAPLRQFALTLGYNDVERKLRFLVFHRGGLAASNALSVETDTKDILRMFMAIVAWSSPVDAGFPEWCNETNMLLPRNCDDTDGVLATIDDVLWDEFCVRGNATRAIRVSYSVDSSAVDQSLVPLVRAPLRFVHHALLPFSDLPKDPTGTDDSHHARLILKSSWLWDDKADLETRLPQSSYGQFGTPPYYYSFLACHETQPITNHLFLPEDDNASNAGYFRLSAKYPRPPPPEYRSLMVHATLDAGQSLVTARTSWDLFEALGHAMLGWLSRCQMGFLHREIDITTVKILDKAAKTRRFEVRRDGTDPLPLKDVARDDLAEFMLKRMSVDRTSDIASEVEGLLDDLEISDMCRGFLNDGRMAIDWRTYFTSPQLGEFTGTPSFMTQSVLYSMTSSTLYIQSPIDDLFSFFYVGQWAVAYNTETDSGQLQILRSQLQIPRGQHYALDIPFRDYLQARDKATLDIGLGHTGARTPFLQQSVFMLREWRHCLVELKRVWAIVELQAKEEGITGKEANELFVPHFYKFALRGVVLYLRLLVRLRADVTAK